VNRRIDPYLFAIVATLVIGGLVMVYSASAMVAADWSGDGTQYIKRQFIAVVIGTGLCVGSALTSMRTFRKYRYVFYIASIFGLLLCYVPGIQHRVNGASRWIGFGSAHLQPAEFAKIAMMIMLADYLHRWRGQIQDHRVLVRAFLIPLPLMLLVFPQPDFGTTVIIGGLAALMIFVAGMSAKHILLTGSLGLIVGIPAMFLEQYRIQRFMSFLDPWENAQGAGYHTIQSWLAMHSGGMWGQGLGNSIAKLHFLPEPWTDYIGAVLAEELGFVRLVMLIALYVLFVWRGIHIAKRARDAFSMYLAATITVMVGAEACFNLGVVMGILPPKGLVLPFISYGATAMITHLWAVGLLFGIAAEADETPVHEGWSKHLSEASLRQAN